MIMAEKETKNEKSLKGIRILVVDDMPTNIDVLFQMLYEEGVDVMAATSGELALDVVAKKRPDLVLLDVNMPGGIDGFETCERMRAVDGLEELPVIFLTAQDDEKSVIEGFGVGGTDYVTKPFQEEALIARIHSHLQRTRLPRAQEEDAREQLLDSPEVLEALSGTEIFQGLEEDVLQSLISDLHWVVLPGGKSLIKQGEYESAIYMLLSGRLRVSLTLADGQEQDIAEIGRGEVVGEISVLTGGLTTANVTAIRDCNLVQISKEAFNRFKDAHPIVLDNVNRILVDRINKRNKVNKREARKHMTLAVVSASRDVALTDFAEKLSQVLAQHGSVLHLNAERVDKHLGSDHAQAFEIGERHRAVASYLNKGEADHNFVIYETDDKPSAWTSRCLRQADRVLIVGLAKDDPTPSGIEAELHASDNTARRELILLHSEHTDQPLGTADWLAQRDVSLHHHIRMGDQGHFERVGRILAGKAICLVLSGGFFRGYAQMGVIRALQDQHIPIDFIGGSSSGAGAAIQCALGLNFDEMFDFHREWVIKKKAVFKYTLPLVSLVKDRTYHQGLRTYFGQKRIEDLWINTFCVSTNLTKAELYVHRSGLVWEAVRASMSMPIFFPPFCHEGDLLVDGGVINNMPVDVMRSLCEGIVLASDVSAGDDMETYSDEFQERSGWSLFLNRINPFAKKIQTPVMTDMIRRMVEVCRIVASRNENKETDYCFYPPVQHFNYFDPKPMHEIAEVGYQHACEQLALWKENASFLKDA